MDRRVKRTRNLLGNALLELVQEKKFEQITIQDITDRADLNRATFYLHYGSKEELLANSLEGHFDALVEQITPLTLQKPIWENPEADEMVFAHVAEHAELTPREKEICEAIGPRLKEEGFIFVGIDVIGDWMTEINVTSPTGIREVKRFSGTDIAALIWDAIEKRK